MDVFLRFLGLIFILALLWYRNYRKNASFIKTVDRLPGLKKYPIIGNSLDFAKNRHRLLDFLMLDIPKLGPVVRMWLVDEAQVFITTARAAEPILKNSAFNDKSANYRMLHDWLGLGLITANDADWRVQRKVLTPAFHLGILHEFLPIFNKNALKLCDKLAKMTERSFDILPHLTLCSLDIICETSMGVEISAQDNGNFDYVHALDSIIELVTHRYLTPWLRPNWIFYFSPTKRQLDKHVKTTRNFTSKVIAERRNKSCNGEKIISHQQDDNIEGCKRRLSFLDVLLTAEKDGLMTDQQIQDQVATFMFTGYDTVSTSACYTLLLIAITPGIQSLIVEELNEVFGESDRSPDMADLANLKYLERCIKESLRLYPIAAIFERNIQQDVQCDNYLVPAGCKATFVTFSLHRDPEFWPEPDSFIPDRFLPENSVGRHPYAYLPFSAGPRNCIGQKFGMLEEKVILSTMLRRFRIEAAQTLDQLKLKPGIVTRPEDGIKLRIFERKEKSL